MNTIKLLKLAPLLFLTLITLGCEQARVSSRAYATSPNTLKDITRFTIKYNPKITADFLDKHYKSDIKNYVSRNQDRIDETTEDMLGPAELQLLHNLYKSKITKLLFSKGLTHSTKNPQAIAYIDFSQGNFTYTVPSKQSITEYSQSPYDVAGKSANTIRYKKEFVGEHTNLSYGLSFCIIMVDTKSNNILWQSSVTGITREEYRQPLQYHLIKKLLHSYPNASPNKHQVIKIKDL